MTADAASDVTFAVLNYNGRELLEIVLPSIYRQTVGGFTVNVVDNGSRDDSVAYLERHWPEITIVRIPDNIGVTAAMNRAVESARTPYVALLNNDIELEPDWLEEIRGALEEHPDAASADGKLLNFHRRSVIDGAGDVLRWSGEPGKRGFQEEDRGQYDRPGPIFSASAGAALFRREAFDRVGPFDEDFFAYFEDVDWGFRAQLMGYSCRYVPTAVAYHMGSATTSRDRGTYAHLMPRNSLLMLMKNAPAGWLARRAPRILSHQLRWLAADVRDRNLVAHLKGWGEALRLLPRALRKRREVQRARVVGARELERTMVPGW